MRRGPDGKLIFIGGGPGNVVFVIDRQKAQVLIKSAPSCAHVPAFVLMANRLRHRAKRDLTLIDVLPEAYLEG